MLASLAFLFLTRTGLACLGFFVVFLLAYYLRFPGALWHNDQRYLYLFIPILVYSMLAALASAHARVRSISRVLLVVTIALQLVEAPFNLRQLGVDREFTRVELGGVTRFVREHLPADAVVRVHVVGFLSFETPFHLVDLVGLKTPSSVGLHRALTWARCGAGRTDAVDLIARRAHATHLVVLQSWDKLFEITQGLRAHGWTLELLTEPGHSYEIYRLTEPPAAGHAM